MAIIGLEKTNYAKSFSRSTRGNIESLKVGIVNITFFCSGFIIIFNYHMFTFVKRCH